MSLDTVLLLNSVLEKLHINLNKHEAWKFNFFDL